MDTGATAGVVIRNNNNNNEQPTDLGDLCGETGPDTGIAADGPG